MATKMVSIPSYRAINYGDDYLSSQQRRRHDMHDYDAVLAWEALQHQDLKNYKRFIEILVSRKSSQIHLMRQAYVGRFKRQLDQDIINYMEPSNPYQKIIVALMASHKAHSADVSKHVATCDAMRLYENSVANFDESVALEILSKRSVPQLKLTFSTYNHIYGHHYTTSLMKRNSGEFENALKLVIECILYNNI